MINMRVLTFNIPYRFNDKLHSKEEMTEIVIQLLVQKIKKMDIFRGTMVVSMPVCQSVHVLQ